MLKNDESERTKQESKGGEKRKGFTDLKEWAGSGKE